MGYGTQKKVNVTGSVATIDSKAFDKRPIVSTSAALQGMAPGVTVTTQSGAPGDDGGAIRIRGINSFGGHARPRRWCSSTASKAVWTASIPT